MGEIDCFCLLQDNRIVGPGIRYPLEVFKTKEGKGWGVRCACDVPAGALLCCYIGNVITDRFAEMLRGLDAYLFDLNHFQQLLMPPEEGRGDENEDGGEDEGENDVQQEQQGGPDGGGSGNQQQQTQQANGQHQQQQANGQQQQQQQRKRPPPAADDERDEVNPNLPPLPADLRDNHLVVDASHEGNVARFINHSCDPNCCLQTVFSGRCRSLLLHYVAVVAVEDIPAFTELTYNYYYMKGTDGETLAAMAAMASDDDTGARRIPCTCGAANCSKWLMIN